MAKLKLDLNDLEVTSFETCDGQDGRGTVVGHKEAPGATFPGLTCNTCPASCGAVCLTVEQGADTCSPSCVGTCGTCAASCDQGYSCDAMATCAQYYTCAYATCAGCQPEP